MNELVQKIIGTDNVDVDFMGIDAIDYDFDIEYVFHNDPILGPEYEIRSVELNNIIGHAILNSGEDFEINLNDNVEIYSYLEDEILNGNRGVDLIEDQVLNLDNYDDFIINERMEAMY